VIRWLVCDYGEVISTSPPRDCARALAVLAGQDVDDFQRRYWRMRLDYDLGQAPIEYWASVLGRDLAGEPELVTRLTRIDVLSWLHLNALTLRTLTEHVRGAGTQLALLSNAPEPLAAAIDGARWSRRFKHRFYSCRVQLAKPDPAMFETVLTHLEVASEEVLFIDDRDENTLAARRLGWRTITFSSATALARELRGIGSI
jgi:putative hydrolase of the HAD superfamily